MKSSAKVVIVLLSGLIAQPVFGQFKVQNTSQTETYMIVNDQGQVAIGTTSPVSDTKLQVNGLTQTTSLRVGTSTSGQALVASDASGTAAWGTVGSAGVTDNSLTATDLEVDVVSSVEGVEHDGGNIDLVPGGNITITPNNTNNTITIGSEPNTFTFNYPSAYVEYVDPHTDPDNGFEQIGSTYTVTESGMYLLLVNVNLTCRWIEGQNTGAEVSVLPIINDDLITDLIPSTGALNFGTNNEAVVRTPGSQTYLVPLNANDTIGLVVKIHSVGSGAYIWGSGGQTRITGVRLY